MPAQVTLWRSAEAALQPIHHQPVQLFRLLRLGPVTAVVVCAVTWAVVHFQYNFVDISLIFLAGLFLGVARLKSGSLWVPIFLHFVWNLVSTIQTAYVAG